MKSIPKRAGTPAVGCSALLAIVLIVTLFVVNEIELFLYPPSYDVLFWGDALSPIFYVTGFAIALLAKPGGDQSNLQVIRGVLDKFQNNDEQLRGINAPRHPLPDSNRNPIRCGLFQVLRKIIIRRRDGDGHTMANEKS
jgi:hypothetical protein